jgi:hypothetical protein
MGVDSSITDTVGLVASSITIAGCICIVLHHVIRIFRLFFFGARGDVEKLRVCTRQRVEMHTKAVAQKDVESFRRLFISIESQPPLSSTPRFDEIEIRFTQITKRLQGIESGSVLSQFIHIECVGRLHSDLQALKADFRAVVSVRTLWVSQTFGYGLHLMIFAQGRQ